MLVSSRKYYMDLTEYFKKFGKRSNKCSGCGKSYKLPNYIFHPRQDICATCEDMNIRMNLLNNLGSSK